MKKVLYVLLGIIALYLVLALFGPKEIKVERHIIINKPVATVKAKLGDFKYFHDEWSPWTEKDPNMSTSYSGTPGEPGHHYAWEGNKEVGKGEMELAGYNGDTLIQKLRFDGMDESKSYFILKDNGNATDVTWGMHFDVGFFGRTPMLFMNMDKMLGEDYEKGLSKLKAKVESGSENTATANYEIDEQNWEEKMFVSTKRTKMSGEECGKFLATNLPKLYADMAKHGMQPTMAPCAIYYAWDDKTMETECSAALCAADPKKAAELKDWERCTIPASKVLHITYYGDYGKSMNAHMSMDKYMKEKQLEHEMVVEEYVTDPMKEKDTTKWLTNIYYVLKNKKG